MSLSEFLQAWRDVLHLSDTKGLNDQETRAAKLAANELELDLFLPSRDRSIGLRILDTLAAGILGEYHKKKKVPYGTNLDNFAAEYAKRPKS